jgi:dipeptidase D
VSGLRGGHSGGDIHQNRGNAIKLLVQTLTGAEVGGLQLAEITGGSKRNAIPREASATVAGPAGTKEALSRAARKVQAEAVEAGGESNCVVRVESDGASIKALSHEDTHRLLTALTAVPSGVLAVVPEIAGLIQTSNNLSTATSEDASGRLRVTAGCLSRSSSDTQLDATARQVAAIGTLSGAEVAHDNAYPGWQPNLDSPLLATCRRVYEELFGKAPDVTAIHAGLECGIIGQRVGAMDTVSIGPRIEGAHSPDERVYVASVQKSWKYLKAVLAELAKG